MSRLPSALQPAWPFVKRVHRATTLIVGFITRRTSRTNRLRALPRRATTTSVETVAAEPGAVTLHRGLGPEHIRRTPPQGEPPGHWTFAERATHDVPGHFVLEMSDGTVVGDYGANITAGGTLDYETSGYFGINSWREHPLFLRPRLPEPKRVGGSVLSLATRGGSVNYYHFLIDVLPRLGVLEDCLPGVVPDQLYVPAATSYQRELLALAGVDRFPIIPTGKHTAVRARTLLVPCMTNDFEVAPRWTIEWLRARLPADTGRDLPRRLYVTRGGARNTRRLESEAGIWPLLEQRGFVRIDPGTMSVRDQIDYFAAADVIVALHGAALANLVFAKPGVKVLELFAPTYVKYCYWAICQNIPGADYRYLLGDGDSRAPGEAMNGIQADIHVSADRLMAMVDGIM